VAAPSNTTRRTEILVASHNCSAEVRVVGRGTYACSQCLREFAGQQVESGVKAFSFDLSECPTMDSTFMGLLAALVVRNRPREVTVEIMNAGEKTKGQLTALGLEGLFTFEERTCRGTTWARLGQPALGETESRRDLRKTMLEAHETLGEVEPANVPRFTGVVETLKDDQAKEV